MSKFISVGNFIIAKSEIISVQFNFSPTKYNYDNEPYDKTKNPIRAATEEVHKKSGWGYIEIIFRLKDGSEVKVQEPNLKSNLTDVQKNLMSQLMEG